MGTLSVKRDGESWGVYDGEKLLEGGLSNSRAWNRMDKLNGEATSKSQDFSNWAFDQQVNRHFGGGE